jgi:hypothetical protein
MVDSWGTIEDNSNPHATVSMKWVCARLFRGFVASRNTEVKGLFHPETKGLSHKTDLSFRETVTER